MVVVVDPQPLTLQQVVVSVVVVRSKAHLCLLALWAVAACSVAAPVADEPTSGRLERLIEAETWMYQIQGLDEPGALTTLAATDYPLLVVEPGHNLEDDPSDMVEVISKLRIAPDGSDRLLLAYVDVGQAEDYRDYWQPSWVAPTETEAGDPEFLLTIDPDGWSGNYVVAYWDMRWKDLWVGDQGIVAELAESVLTASTSIGSRPTTTSL